MVNTATNCKDIGTGVRKTPTLRFLGFYLPSNELIIVETCSRLSIQQSSNYDSEFIGQMDRRTDEYDEDMRTKLEKYTIIKTYTICIKTLKTIKWLIIYMDI